MTRSVHRQPSQPKPRPAVASRYRCSLHSEVVVSWKGKGCRKCDEHSEATPAPAYDWLDVPIHRI